MVWPWKTNIIKESVKTFEGAVYEAKARKGKEKGLYPGQFSRAKLLTDLDNLFLNNGDVSSAIWTIAGQVMGRGYETEPASPQADIKSGDKSNKEDKEVKEADKVDDKALKAKQLVDQFATDCNLDGIIYEGSMWIPLHGIVFLQKKKDGSTKKDDGGSLLDLRILPWQSSMEPLKADEDSGYVVKWARVKQGQRDEKNPFIDGEHDEEGDLVIIRMPPMDEEGWGCSIIRPIMRTLNTQNQLVTDLQVYLHKSALPTELYCPEPSTSGERPDDDTTKKLKTKVSNKEPGDKIVTNWPIKAQVVGVGQLETRMLPAVLEMFQHSIVTAVMTPPMSYLRNATEASARAMLKQLHISLIQPIQRLWKRKIEYEVFLPVLKANQIEKEFLPSINFQAPTEEEIAETVKRIMMMYAPPGGKEGIIDREEARAIAPGLPEIEKTEDSSEQKSSDKDSDKTDTEKPEDDKKKGEE